ncbi:hypothetical protein DM43_379 [Burkholderia cepacia]|uniref:Uncharacterized protein n=1 Tax=Burkholderia cepacia TaxID=292 RepID=A0AA89C9B5_BURCE|nr:hypothetical protein DM43_379 [Burkholderia cepacia]
MAERATDEPAMAGTGRGALTRRVRASGKRHASGCYLAMAWPVWTGIELQLEHVSTVGLP